MITHVENLEQTIDLHGKQFEPFISADEIAKMVTTLGEKIDNDFKGQNPLFIGVLNGSFLFMADLIRKYNGDCTISFIKVASYQGTQTTGQVKQLIGLNAPLEGRIVIIVEDIVDTGNALEFVYNEILKLKPNQLKVATLLLKPDVYNKTIKLDYVGREIPNKFIVGYGLDYDELGRNLNDIYAATD